MDFSRKALAAQRAGLYNWPTLDQSQDLTSRFGPSVYGPRWLTDDTLVFSGNMAGDGDGLRSLNLTTGVLAGIYPGHTSPGVPWKIGFNTYYAGAGVVAGNGDRGYWDNTSNLARHGTGRVALAVDDLTGTVCCKNEKDGDAIGVWSGNTFQQLFSNGNPWTAAYSASFRGGVLVFQIGPDFYKWMPGQAAPIKFQSNPSMYPACNWSGGWNLGKRTDTNHLYAWPDGQPDQEILVSGDLDPWHLFSQACVRVGNLFFTASTYGEGELAGELQRRVLDITTRQVRIPTAADVAVAAAYVPPAYGGQSSGGTGGGGVSGGTVSIPGNAIAVSVPADLPVPLLILVGGVLVYMYSKGDIT